MGAAAPGLKSALADRATILWFDRIHTIKELIKDPIYDVLTLPETVIPDPTNTLAEGIGVNVPGGYVTNPAIQAFSAQAQPVAAALSNIATTIYLDRPHTLAWFDSPHTIKELIKDPIQDPVTLPETYGGGGGGTLQEGVGGIGGVVTNPVWGLPGMMF
jgi:hypothetical protein